MEEKAQQRKIRISTLTGSTRAGALFSVTLALDNWALTGGADSLATDQEIYAWAPAQQSLALPASLR